MLSTCFKGSGHYWLLRKIIIKPFLETSFKTGEFDGIKHCEKWLPLNYRSKEKIRCLNTHCTTSFV